ncbi:MAG TPA: universal stress protein [Terracidiphilus sp.]|nr:universal stress protein [Terracidiphilus sp.]
MSSGPGLQAGSEHGMDRWVGPAAILVATNLSDLDRLMPFAFQMATETGARILLLHVLPASASLTVDAAGMPYYDPAGAMEYAGKDLEPWCAQARSRHLSCDAIVREGQPAQEIVSAVRQFHADWLLLGTRSRGKLGKLLLGSVAEQVLRSVRLPVITVGPEAHLPLEGSNQPKTVLHATTLGETSRPNAALACQIAARQKAKLILLHVLPHIDEMQRKHLPADFDSAVLHELHTLAAEAGGNACENVEARVLHGNPAIEILAEAAACHARLIILGAVRHSVFENLARDRTVHRVLAHAHCPVLTLREPIEKAEHAEAETFATHA